MGYIDFVLNLVGLLLWINWRSLGFVAAPSALSIASTIRPADKQRGGRVIYLALLPVLLVLRALFYWQLAGALEWVPKLPLGILVISFKCETLGRYLIYSVVSFSLALAIFFSWLFLLSASAGQAAVPDPVTRLIRQHLGPLGHWPCWIQVLFPFAAAALLWPPAQWLFAGLDLMPAKAGWSLVREALGMSLAVLLAWKHLLVGLLFLYFMNSYVYLGASSVWDFVNLAGRKLLTPLRWLRVGKMDLSPLLGIILVIGVCEGITRWTEWLPALEKRVLPIPMPALIPAATNQ